MPATITNGANCKKFVLGTGMVDCEIRPSQPISVIRVPNNWSFDLTNNGAGFNLEYAIGQTASGIFAPFLNTIEFTNNTPETTTQDYQDGGTAVVRNGKPTYMMSFNNGLGFHKAAYQYNGYGTNSVLLIDSVGNVWGQINDAGTVLRGFPTNMFNTATYQPKAGDTNAATNISFQIKDEDAFNRNLVLISREDIGANLNNELLGVVSVNIEVRSADVSDGTVVIKVTGVNNPKFGIQALNSVGAWDLVNVTANTISAISNVAASTTEAGVYTLTPTTMPTVGQVIQIQTKQFGLGEAYRVSPSAQLYRGISPEKTTVA